MEGLRVITQPTIEPITQDEAKLHSYIDGDDQNNEIDAIIAAARGQVETHTGRALISQGLQYTLDCFPSNIIELPRPRLISVESISYTDENGDAQTFTDYQIDTYSEPGRIAPASGYSWPTVSKEVFAPVTINYTAGYGTASTDVPPELIAAVKLMFGHLFENREATTPVSITELPLAYQSLIAAHALPVVV